MPDMTNPELLKTPLAKNGDKNTLPLTTGATTGLFSQDLGFQEINSTPLTAGGKAPDRKDMNAVFNLLGGVAFMAQKGWTFHYDSTQDYYLGCVVIDPADGNRYECIADMAAGTVAPHEDTDGDYWRRFTLGDGEAVGVIKAFAGNGDLPSGYLLCDGSAVSRTMYPDLFSAIGTTYGSGDGSTTFNLPDYNTAQRFAQGGTVAGVEKEAGLPNIEGTFSEGIPNSATTTRTAIVQSGSGAFGIDNSSAATRNTFTSGALSTTSWPNIHTFDASRSNPVYGNSDTVQPNALTTRYIIKAFDGQTASSALIDLTQYANDLASRLQRQQVPAFNHRDVITTSGTYTAPVTGWYRITVKGGGGGGAHGYTSTDTAEGGPGGGEGGTTIGYEYLTAGDTVAVVVGAGGAGGTSASSQSAAGDGGTSSATANSTTYSATGGKGALTGYSAGTGGTGTINGAPGCTRSDSHQGWSFGSSGGGAGGGICNVITDSPTAATQGGGGAGGAARLNSTTRNGGNGGPGFAWFEYFDPTLP